MESYTTITGHTIVVGAEYNTRDGRVATITEILDNSHGGKYPIKGKISGLDDSQMWMTNGRWYTDDESEDDLMTPVNGKSELATSITDFEVRRYSKPFDTLNVTDITGKVHAASTVAEISGIVKPEHMVAEQEPGAFDESAALSHPHAAEDKQWFEPHKESVQEFPPAGKIQEPKDIAKDLRAKIADLNEALELAALYGVSVKIEVSDATALRHHSKRAKLSATITMFL